LAKNNTIAKPLFDVVFLSEQSLQTDSKALYLDSAKIVRFIEINSEFKKQQKNLISYYKNRSYAFAWINKDGLIENAGNFINLLKQEKNLLQENLSPENSRLLELFNNLNHKKINLRKLDTAFLDLELLLSGNFFNYAHRNLQGSEDDKLKSVKWFIERKKVNYEEALNAVLNLKNSQEFSLQPNFRQYNRLKVQLEKYAEIKKQNAWPSISPKCLNLKLNDSSVLLKAVKQLLSVTGDLSVLDSSAMFNDSLLAAILKFQKRHGIKLDSSINKTLLDAFKIGPDQRIQQILINMERCRWVASDMQGDYISVNIPDYKLLVFKDSKVEWSCRVIVGQTKEINNTVIFNDQIEFVVFSPYWNIPPSILIKETLPAIKRNRRYISTHHLEVINSKGQKINPNAIKWNRYSKNFPYSIRQKPGEDNALGLVKFLFPNNYNIYLHDTPNKSLFKETSRAFSHGCIRVEEPFKLAAYLLKNDTNWTEAKIDSAMHGGEEIYVKLSQNMPVFITYFTAWVDRNGQVNFRDDIYLHDARMKKILFAN
jgi:murein L,D-transpeptidase YcbB/YkuD